MSIRVNLLITGVVGVAILCASCNNSNNNPKILVAPLNSSINQSPEIHKGTATESLRQSTNDIENSTERKSESPPLENQLYVRFQNLLTKNAAEQVEYTFDASQSEPHRELLNYFLSIDYSERDKASRSVPAFTWTFYESESELKIRRRKQEPTYLYAIFYNAYKKSVMLEFPSGMGGVSFKLTELDEATLRATIDSVLNSDSDLPVPKVKLRAN